MEFIIKGKEQLFVSTKQIGEVDMQIFSFLTSALDGVGSQLHSPTSFPRRSKLYPLKKRSAGRLSV